jgi:hypothetical protein
MAAGSGSGAAGAAAAGCAPAFWTVACRSAHSSSSSPLATRSSRASITLGRSRDSPGAVVLLSSCTSTVYLSPRPSWPVPLCPTK